MSSKSALLAAVVTAALVTGVVVLPASGHYVKPSGTLSFTGKGSKRDQKVIDIRPKGLSLGDHFLGSETLRQAGAVAGRLAADCVVSTEPMRAKRAASRSSSRTARSPRTVRALTSAFPGSAVRRRRQVMSSRSWAAHAPTRARPERCA